jgi:hypothetical protein
MSSSLFAELSSASITLEEVKAQFAHWRGSRTKVDKIPNALWNAAKQLTKQYECRQIAAELKLIPFSKSISELHPLSSPN